MSDDLSNTPEGAIDTDRAANMAAFDALPAAFDALPAELREALREATLDFACEPVLSAYRSGMPVSVLRAHLRRREAS